MRTFAGLVFVGSVLVCSPAQATPIIAAASGLTAPASTITFSEVVLANGTLLSNQYSALGLTFSNLWYNTQPFSFGNLQAPVVENFNGTDSFSFNPFLVLFNSPVTSAALTLGSNAGQTTRFTALLNNVVVETFVSPTDLNGVNNWFGFTNIAFNELRMEVLAGGGNRAAIIDNIQVGQISAAVPEPATLLLLGLGLAGLARYRRRK